MCSNEDILSDIQVAADIAAIDNMCPDMGAAMKLTARLQR
jgi:hypothetical protein